MMSFFRCLFQPEETKIKAIRVISQKNFNKPLKNANSHTKKNRLLKTEKF